jgi:hypothetical protein
MSNDVAKTTTYQLDAFDGFNDFTNEVEGEEERVSGRVIQGNKIKFIDPRWLDNTGKDITGKLLTAIGVRNVVSKWGHDNTLLASRILAPGEKFPNFDELNRQCDKSEWRDSFGERKGPWEGQHVVYFIDELYNKYSWPSPTTTVGSSICVREFADQVAMVRKFKGNDVFAVTELGHTDFPTAYGLKQRPDLLKIKEWVSLRSDQTGDPLPAPDSEPAIDVTPTSASPALAAPAGAQHVDKLTAKEVTGDEIMF